MNRDGQSVDQIGENIDNSASRIPGKAAGNKKLIKNNAKASTRSDQSLETISAQHLANKEDSSAGSATNSDYIHNSAENAPKNIDSLSGGKSVNQLLEPAATGIPNSGLGSNQGGTSNDAPQLVLPGTVRMGPSGSVQSGITGLYSQIGGAEQVGTAGTAKFDLPSAGQIGAVAGAPQIGADGASTDRRNCSCKSGLTTIFFLKLATLESTQAQINGSAPKLEAAQATANETNAGAINPGLGVAALDPQTNTTTADPFLIPDEVEETTTTSTTTTPEPETTPIDEPIYDDIALNATVDPLNNTQINVTNSTIPCEQYKISMEIVNDFYDYDF